MTRPVVFVPGLPASRLRDADDGRLLFLKLPPPVDRLLGPDDLDAGDGVVAGEPVPKVKIAFFDLIKFAESLYRVLADLGVEGDLLEKVGWDWRRPVWDEHPEQVQERIGRAVEAASDRHGPVVMILHSTGGLAGRWFLEQAEPSMRDRIAAVAAVGVPWVGTLDAFAPLLGRQGFPFTSKRDVQRMMGHAWAGFDLLPPDPDRVQDGAYTQARLVVGPHPGPGGELAVSSPLVETAWMARHVDDSTLRNAMNLRRAAADARLGDRRPVLGGIGAHIPTILLVGWGHQTLRQAVLRPGGEVELSTGVDGSETLLDDGDGTVPRPSAAWLRGGNVRRFHVPVGRYEHGGERPHARLWENPGAAAVLDALIHDRAIAPQAEAAMDWSDYVETGSEVVTVRCQASDGDGEVPPDARIRLRLAGTLTPWQGVDRTFGGRHVVQVERDSVPPVGGQPFRRLEVEIDLGLGGPPRRIPLVCRR